MSAFSSSFRARFLVCSLLSAGCTEDATSPDDANAESPVDGSVPGLGDAGATVPAPDASTAQEPPLPEAGVAGDASAADSGADAEVSGPPLPFTCPGGTIAAGVNSMMVRGQMRSFNADLPADPTKSMGVLFSWHGFNDSWMNHREKAGLDPDANPDLPVVVITPDDTGIQPPMGLDWDIVRGDASVNPDLGFFEAILGCLDAQYSIDSRRIYSYGFSAGAVMTNLLHSRYPQILSAVIAESGGWFNDPVQQKFVNFLTVDWSWPALDPRDGGAVLLTHGGANDVTVLWVFDLEKAAQAAMPFLASNERVVVDCPHDGGHALHPQITGAVVGDFISAHRAGSPSPYLTAGDAGSPFPASCTVRLP